MKNNKTMYCVVMITQNDVENLSIDCLGVFDDEAKALYVAGEMQKCHEIIGFTEKTVYEVLPYELNEIPMLLKFQRARVVQIEQTNDKVDEVLEKLIKSGHVNQLVGEDGHFYYELTAEGRQSAKKIPEMIKKLFKK